MLRFLIASVLLLAACAASYNGKTPAADGVQALIRALRGEDPRRAYALLAADMRATISYREFEELWRASSAERAWQSSALEASLRGAPTVGERAVVRYSDGKSVPLERDGQRWRIEAPLVTVAQTPQPRDAVRALADALERRDVDDALALLTARRREGLARQIQGFLQGFGKHVNAPIEAHGDSAELRWDEAGIRYRVMLRREDGEWRIDDISIRLSPQEDGEDAEQDSGVKL